MYLSANLLYNKVGCTLFFILKVVKWCYYRKLRKLTQKELGDAIDTATTTVSGWERGVTTPDIDTLFAICNLLQVSLNDMCGVLSEVENFSVTSEERKLLSDYHSLNQKGKDKLQERMEELHLLGYVNQKPLS